MWKCLFNKRLSLGGHCSSLLLQKLSLKQRLRGVGCQASSHFEAMNSAHLSMCQKDVRPSAQKSWRTMAFFRVSTGDSVIRSSCEMKYEPAFKPLQGNPAFFWVRAFRGPFQWGIPAKLPNYLFPTIHRPPNMEPSYSQNPDNFWECRSLSFNLSSGDWKERWADPWP